MFNIKALLITVGICFALFVGILIPTIISYESRLKGKDTTIKELKLFIKEDIKQNFTELKEGTGDVIKKINELDKAIIDRNNAVNELYNAWLQSRFTN